MLSYRATDGRVEPLMQEALIRSNKNTRYLTAIQHAKLLESQAGSDDDAVLLSAFCTYIFILESLTKILLDCLLRNESIKDYNRGKLTFGKMIELLKEVVSSRDLNKDTESVEFSNNLITRLNKINDHRIECVHKYFSSEEDSFKKSDDLRMKIEDVKSGIVELIALFDPKVNSILYHMRSLLTEPT